MCAPTCVRARGSQYSAATCTYMGNRIRLEIVWLLINWGTVQTQAENINK